MLYLFPFSGGGFSESSGGILGAIYVIVGLLCLASFFLAAPVAALTGLHGRNKIMNGCMSCGHKWYPGE
ncbi:hypothetical protein BBD42_02995 [Paenibacillus sp. BIHB 4019]|uniref:Uncharacterized protein n=2 Tax=Paenibacillus sp. BIHB 4019 TaxID=1870819 RepID=A0A1B2DS50_9BACL|nr:hypothetical protein BBD42_02995 [Paenibacillus sp. BIHB 4019]